ncbi:MAG TPA: tetratricopeptide repeat protein [Planctomycetaceae bacterium]|nr:tetratricopeptide repeat protein [Planctomycetaceae bacterium]
MANDATETRVPQSHWKKWTAYVALLLLVFGIGTVVYWFLKPLPMAELVNLAEQALRDEQFARATQYTDQILARQPDSLMGLQMAAVAAAEQGNHDRALRCLLKIPSTARPERIGGTLGDGVATEEMVNLSAIEKMSREALKDDPQHIVARDRLGFVLGVGGRRWEGQSHFIELIRRGQFTEVHLLWLGDIQRTVGTLRYLERCRQVNSQDPLVLQGLARVYIDRDQMDEATKLLQEAVDLNPRQLAAHAWLGRTLLNHPKRFLQWHQELPQTADEHPEIWVTRGKWALQNEQAQEAIRCFWEAVYREPNHRLANYQLGRLLLTEKQDEQAHAFLQRAEQLSELMKMIGIVGNRDGPLTPADEQYVKKIAELTESLGRMWETWAWAQIAQSKDQRLTWPRQVMQRTVRTLNQGTPATLHEYNPARQFNLASYPLPDWDQQVVDNGTGSSVPANSTAIGFVDDASASGIQFQYVNGAQPQRGPFMFEFTGGGIAVLDYDGDSWPDIYLTQGCQWPAGSAPGQHRDRLYRNLGNGRFADVTEAAGLGDDLFSQGVTVGDLNNDGFPDLYVANIGQNRLYVNVGDGTFQDISSQIKNSASRWTTSCLLVDLNGDGFADIYDVNYLKGKQIFQQVCDKQLCHPNEFDAEQDQLLLNNGQGEFSDVTASAGILTTHGNGLGIIAADFKGNQQLDLFVANDAVANTFLKRRPKQENETQLFDENATIMGLAFDRDGAAQACMGVAAGDADQDGLLDLFITNYFRESNTLYQQQGGMFVDATRPAGLREASFSWLGFGTQFLDADLDGLLDLVITNGHVDDYSKVGQPFEMPPQLFRNRGQAHFQELASQGLGFYFQQRYRGRGLARLDWNRDGREDFVVSHLDAPVALLTNQTKQHGNHLAVQLVGTASSRDAIGSRVTVTSGDNSWTAQLTAGDGYQASNQRQLVFGLGQNHQPDKLTVHWISGATQTFTNLPLNSEIRIVEGQHSYSLLSKNNDSANE